MEEEIKRRISILENKKVPRITARMLHGGMQERLHRQEAIRYGKKIGTQKTKLREKLSLIEQEKLIEPQIDEFGALSSSVIEPLEAFDEPVFRKIRSKRGFFNE